MTNNIKDQFGNIDIYLFDQLLKGTYDNCQRVIDIGCGNGRNIIYFLKNGFDVYGIDQSIEAIEVVKTISATISKNDPANFKVGLVEALPFANDMFDLAICSAVLHFARDHDHFNTMVNSIWRILKPGGFLFARLASDIGIEELVIESGDGRYFLPDESERYLVNYEKLVSLTKQLGGEFYEPIKTTNVQNFRCMTTWCIRKKD